MSEFLENENRDKKPTAVNLLKRIGVAGFLFFLIKGLVWLIVIFGLGKGCQSFF